jgi:hypothetical protein
MKLLAGSMLMIALALCAAVSTAKTPPSSFVPRNYQEPHATLSNKSGSKQGRQVGGGASSHKVGRHVNSSAADHNKQRPRNQP